MTEWSGQHLFVWFIIRLIFEVKIRALLREIQILGGQRFASLFTSIATATTDTGEVQPPWTFLWWVWVFLSKTQTANSDTPGHRFSLLWVIYLPLHNLLLTSCGVKRNLVICSQFLNLLSFQALENPRQVVICCINLLDISHSCWVHWTCWACRDIFHSDSTGNQVHPRYSWILYL